MLDDHGRGHGELAHEIQGAVEIENVVVRQLLAVQHLGGGDRTRACGRLNVEPRLLMRVLAVAQLVLALEAQVEAAWPGLAAGADPACKVAADGLIVGGRARECRRRQSFARRQ